MKENSRGQEKRRIRMWRKKNKRYDLQKKMTEGFPW